MFRFELNLHSSLHQVCMSSALTLHQDRLTLVSHAGRQTLFVKRAIRAVVEINFATPLSDVN